MFQNENNKWASITAQSSLLGMNVLLVSQGKVNSYSLLSIAFVFSLFALQAVSYRFLIFKPVNRHVQRPVFHFDTFLLFAFTFLAGVLFFLSLLTIYKIEPLVSFETKLKNHVLWIFTILVVILPLYFLAFGRTQIRRSITNRLRPVTFQYVGNCDECGNPGAVYTNIVLDWNDLRIRKQCGQCGDDETVTGLVIG